MKLVVNGIDFEVDNRHIKSPLIWVLRYILGPDDSAQGSQDSRMHGDEPYREQHETNPHH
jgi:hypothetical protein